MSALKMLPLRTTLAAALLVGAGAQAGTLEVRLNHLGPEGTVHIDVFGDAESWGHDGRPVATRMLPAREVGGGVRIEGLAAGRYAVRVQQEGIAEPGNVWPLTLSLPRHGSSGGNNLHAAPSFDHAAVEVRDENAHVAVHLFTDSGY